MKFAKPTAIGLSTLIFCALAAIQAMAQMPPLKPRVAHNCLPLAIVGSLTMFSSSKKPFSG